jgi:hypothetical protein
MSLLIEWPLLAAIPGVIFMMLYRRSRRRIVLLAGVGWLAYSLYELGMRWRILCSGECNIRVDLLLIYPILILVTLLGLVAASRRQAT